MGEPALRTRRIRARDLGAYMSPRFSLADCMFHVKHGKPAWGASPFRISSCGIGTAEVTDSISAQADHTPAWSTDATMTDHSDYDLDLIVVGTGAGWGMSSALNPPS